MKIEWWQINKPFIALCRKLLSRNRKVAKLGETASFLLHVVAEGWGLSKIRYGLKWITNVADMRRLLDDV